MASFLEVSIQKLKTSLKCLCHPCLNWQPLKVRQRLVNTETIETLDSDDLHKLLESGDVGPKVA